MFFIVCSFEEKDSTNEFVLVTAQPSFETARVQYGWTTLHVRYTESNYGASRYSIKTRFVHLIYSLGILMLIESKNRMLDFFWNTNSEHQIILTNCINYTKI